MRAAQLHVTFEHGALPVAGGRITQQRIVEVATVQRVQLGGEAIALALVDLLSTATHSITPGPRLVTDTIYPDLLGSQAEIAGQTAFHRLHLPGGAVGVLNVDAIEIILRDVLGLSLEGLGEHLRVEDGGVFVVKVRPTLLISHRAD
ncbi:hypothetical protein D3C77_561820 [compost metagenome]